MRKVRTYPTDGAAQDFNRPRLMGRDYVFPDRGFPLGVKKSPEQGKLDFHVHENFSELVVVMGGNGVHWIEGRRYNVVAGDVFLVLGDLVHGYEGASNLTIYNVLFDWEALRLPQYDLSDSAAFQVLFRIDPVNEQTDRFDHRFRLSADEFSSTAKLIDRLDDLIRDTAEGHRFAATGAFIELIMLLINAYNRAAKHAAFDNIPHRIGKLAGLLEQNYAEDISIDMMCRQTGMSYATLFRHFRRYYRDSPVNYLIRQRLRHAAELLANSEVSVSDAALRCGFSDGAYFSRKFKEYYSMPPMEYRKKSKS